MKVFKYMQAVSLKKSVQLCLLFFSFTLIYAYIVPVGVVLYSYGNEEASAAGRFTVGTKARSDCRKAQC